MAAQTNTRGYDVFKLVVGVILLIIFVVLLLRVPQPPERAALPTTTLAQQSSATAQLSSSTPLPTATLQLPTSTWPPSATVSPTATATQTPGATSTPITPTPASAASSVVCAGARPARLRVGDTARVTTSLNMRSAPGVASNLILANPGDTRLQIIGGPVCLAEEGGGYVWWQLQRPDGLNGWSAEASLNASFYFLEPVP